MSQKFLHAAQVEVDSQGRANSGPLATEAKQDDILAALGADATLVNVAVSQAAGGPTALVAAPGAGKQIWVVGGFLTMSASGTISLLSAATPISGVLTALAGPAWNQCGSPANPVFKCGTNEALNLTNVTGTVTGHIRYIVHTL